MPFHQPGANVPRAFTKISDNRKRYPSNHLAEVVSYDLTSAVMVCKRIEDGQEMEVHINPQKSADARARAKEPGREAGRWSGPLIDGDMAKHLPPGTWVALEGCHFQGRRKVGGKERFIEEANWIHQASSNSPEKAIRGVLTISSYMGRVDFVQHFSDQTLDIVNNADAIKKLAAVMDEVEAAYDPEGKVFQPRYGFQLRTLLKTDRTRDIYNAATKKKETVPVFELIDAGFARDWYFDDSGSQRVSRPISGRDLLESIDGVKGAEGSDDVPGYADYIEERYKADIDRLVIEVLPYQAYRASQSDSSFVMPRSDRAPLSRMAHTPMRLAQGEGEEAYVGKNFAVRDILLLVGDNVGMGADGKPVIVKSYLAKRILVNGSLAPLQQMLRSSTGGVVDMAPELAPPKLSTTSPATPGSTASAHDSAGASAFVGASETDLDAFGSGKPVSEAQVATDPGHNAYVDAFGVEGADPFGAAFDSTPAAPVAAQPAAQPAVKATQGTTAGQPVAQPQGSQAASGGLSGRRRLGG